MITPTGLPDWTKRLSSFSKIVVNWITSELFAYLKKDNIAINKSPISPLNLGKLIHLIIDDKISGKIAKEVFHEMYLSSKSPNEIISEKGILQVTDVKMIESIIDKILKNNQDKVREFQSGKGKLLGYFVGLAMKECKGQANPKKLNQILKDKLNIKI